MRGARRRAVAFGAPAALRSATPCCAARSAKRSDDVVEQLADVDRLAAQAELGLVELGQVAERLHHAGGVARVAQGDLDQAAVLGARRLAPTQRPSSVSRQATVAVSGERRSCDRLLTPSRRKWSVRRSAFHCRRQTSSSISKAPVSWPNSSLVGAGNGLSGATVEALGEAALRQRRRPPR